MRETLNTQSRAMSNPFKTPLAKVSATIAELEEIPYPVGLDFEPKEIKSIEDVVRAVQDSKLDLRLVSSVKVDKEWCLDETLLNAKKEGGQLYRSDTGKWFARTRTGPLVKAAVLIRREQTAQMQSEIDQAVGRKIAVGGGAHYALGRLLKFYPKKGARPSLPPTREEAKRAYERCGLPAGSSVRSIEIGEVRTNRKAENGFPIGGTGQTPHALSRAVDLAQQIRALLGSAADFQNAWKSMEEARPSWTLCKGKAKYDVYTVEKVKESMLRFYNVIPRQLVLLMQQATQPFEDACKPCPESNSSQGVALTRGGHEILTDFLEPHTMCRMKYVHHGDDSWCVIRIADEVVMFALDCSSFDLTQHEETTAPVHEVIYENLRAIDPVSAGVWKNLMRKRRVTIAGTVVAEMRHGGPSGMPLQSKVNDVLMEILLARIGNRVEGFLAKAVDEFDYAFMKHGDVETTIGDIVQAAASEMGFVVRLEQFKIAQWNGQPKHCMKDALHYGFVYLGYQFFTDEEGRLRVQADLPRQLAQLPYSTRSGYMPHKGMHMSLSALKLAGVLLAGGFPEYNMEPVLKHAREFLRSTYESTLEEERDEILDSFVHAGLNRVMNSRTVEALCRHLTVDGLRDLWMDSATFAQMMEGVAKLSWADEVAERNDAIEGEVRYSVPLIPDPRRPSLGRPRQQLECTAAQVGRVPARPAVDVARAPALAGASSRPRRKAEASYSRTRAYDAALSEEDSDWGDDYDGDETQDEEDYDWGLR